MTARLAACLFTCIVALAGPQTPARDAAAAPPVPGTASLSGVVKDADGNPLRRASVSISGDMRLDRETITDDAGRFAFSALPAGRFTITATKAGYPPMSYGARRPYRTGSGVLLADGQQAGDLVLTLARGAVLAGTMFDDRGQPMPGVPVMAWEVRTALSGDRTLSFPQTGAEAVTTDDRGSYRIYGLPPGEYTVGTAWFYGGSGDDIRVPADAEIRAAFLAVTQGPAVSSPGATPAAAPAVPPRYNYAPVFYPDAVDPLAALTLPLASGEERAGIDLHMQLRPMSRIEGVVVGPDGAGVTARMTLSRRSRVQALNTSRVWSAAADGRFTSPSLSPSDYTVMAEVAGGAGKPPLWAMSDVTIAGAEPITVRLTLQPGLTVGGRLRFERTTLDPPGDLSRALVYLFALPGTRPPQTVSSTDASGAFTITGVTPGRYRVTASVPNPAPAGQPAWSVRSVVLGGRDVTDVPIDIAPGDAPSMTVIFTDQVSELSGMLTTASGQPATDYFVIALPADRQYWLQQSRRIASARPDTSGRYVFRGLPAGEYRIAVTTDLVSGDLSDAAALDQLAAQSTPVTLGLGEKKTLSIKVGG
jgi:protocatechuate 3,4-dioxygenase beta subunit